MSFKMPIKQSIVIAITGASGSIYANMLIEALQKLPEHVDLSTLAVVCSEKGKEVYAYETGNPVTALADVKHFANNDFFAPFASGSSNYDALVIVPCSMGTMGRIAHGVSDSLITRTADVMLKERRKLILVLRETPYNLVHIKNMELLCLAGAVICPASPSFYSKPADIPNLCNTVVERVISLLDIQNKRYSWGCF